MLHWHKGYRIEVFGDGAGLWCWHVLNRCGEVLDHGIMCPTEQAALDAARTWIDEEVDG